ncbi:uncharacterized protein PV09_08987 [Verruconis gallopava]|uniref:Protein BFR2 n=1 Tax=Verruconis gallopava TaxID=253628 RepID=A0A0D1ZXX9_9PEZI|nr:uncharacterized protein PV09_08987 [Verruconis gallopava]KIV99327.1 hypothetical protein PV09_08987 [Verruconis gallopava]
MARPKTRAQKLQELSDVRAKDFDPEDVGEYNSDSETNEFESDNDAPIHAREHYEEVGKSKLRKPQPINLGPQYAGLKVRRDALNVDDDEDDPFSRDYGDSDSANEISASDQDGEEESLSEGLNGSSDEDRSDNEAGTDLTHEEDDESDDEGSVGRNEGLGTARNADGIDREELRKLMIDDQKHVAATLSQSAKADAEKGKAVKAQRSTFDTLLNARIKLQKALIATNSLLASHPSKDITESEQDVIHAAEVAALKLWNNLNDLRTSLQSIKTGQKRSHRQFTTQDSIDELWEEMKTYETAQKKPRITGLDFWASKTRAMTSLPQSRGRLQQSIKENQLSDVLAAQLADIARLVSKTQVARSCAPIQAASVKKPQASTGDARDDDASEKEPEKLPIYDDADFYTILLANLISQRSSDATINLSNLSIQPWQAAREAKTKKVVDTKASKGRKLRYTVHEKLVSFMAPEDRGSWGERQAEELFSSLFGRRIALEEDHENFNEDAEEDKEIEGLKLFGGQE